MFQPSRTECMNVCLGHEELYNSKHVDMNPTRRTVSHVYNTLYALATA